MNLLVCLGTFTTATIQPGDRLKFCRAVYSHWAIATGEGTGVEFSSADSEVDLKRKHNTDIMERPLEQIIQGGEWYIDNTRDESAGSVYEGSEVVAGSRRQIGRHAGDYSLAFSNCECFVNYCRYGESVSEQAITAGTFGVAAACAAAGLAVAGGWMVPLAGWVAGGAIGNLGSKGVQQDPFGRHEE